MPSSISSNTVFQTIVVLVLAAHVGALAGFWYAPRGLGWLLSLNVVVALAVVGYAGTRARFILAGMDWPYLALVAFELIVLIAAFLAFRANRPAMIFSCVACGLHLLTSIGAVVFAFTFKIRLM
jgi:hypothetical protein